MKKIKNVNRIANSAGIITSCCVGLVVGKVIGAALPTNIGIIERIAVMIGTSAIGGYVGDKVGNRFIDETKIVCNAINSIFPEEKELYASQEFHAV